MVFSTPVVWMPTPLESSQALSLNNISLPGTVSFGVLLIKRAIIAHQNQTATLASALDYRVPECKELTHLAFPGQKIAPGSNTQQCLSKDCFTLSNICLHFHNVLGCKSMLLKLNHNISVSELE